MSISSQIIRILELAKVANAGVSTKDFSKKLKTTPAKIHQAIHRLRAQKYKIELKNFLYYLASNPDATVTTRAYHKKGSNGNGKTAHLSVIDLNQNDLKKEIGQVHQEDQGHYVEYMKKAIFYRNCALQLIRANELTRALLPN